MARYRGFSLLEMMIATVLTAIMLTIGVPSFNKTVQQNCAVSGASALLGALTHARDEAITRNSAVSICKSIDGLHCSRAGSTQWSQGFITFIDPDHDGVLAPTEKMLAATMPFLSCAALSSNKYLNYVSFDSEGAVNSNGSFFITANGAADINRTVAIFVGRVRICSAKTDRNCPAPP